MQIKICLILLFIVSCISASSQQSSPYIVASAGGIAQGNTMQLEWTMGELATETITSTERVYTQGFHQPLLQIKKSTPAKELNSLDIGIHIYPNPVTNLLNIDLGVGTNENLFVRLFDNYGKEILKKQCPPRAGLVQLNLHSYPQGIYLLQVSNSNRTLSSKYKIIKTH